MGNKAKAKAQAQAEPQAQAPQAAPVVLVVGKAPRIAGHTATKHGKGGTAGTWQAIADHMAKNDGTITLTDLQAVCAANGDAGFARYAMGKQRLWLVPRE